MDRISDLARIVQPEVAAYHTIAWKAKSYYLADDKNQIYAVIDIPEREHPIEDRPAIIVMARIDGERVIIVEDITDRPLYEALMRAGIPREQIVLAYAGESLSSESAS
jgi:hypothetical protein